MVGQFLNPATLLTSFSRLPNADLSEQSLLLSLKSKATQLEVARHLLWQSQTSVASGLEISDPVYFFPLEKQLWSKKQEKTTLEISTEVLNSMCWLPKVYNCPGYPQAFFYKTKLLSTFRKPFTLFFLHIFKIHRYRGFEFHRCLWIGYSRNSLECLILDIY